MLLEKSLSTENKKTISIFKDISNLTENLIITLEIIMPTHDEYFSRYQIFEHFLDGVFVINQNKEVVYCNILASQLFGLSQKRVLGKLSYEHFIFEEKSLFCMQDGTEGSDQPSQYFETPFSSSKGVEGHVQVMIQPDKIFSTDKEKFWIVYFHDVTQEKQLSTKYRTTTKENKRAQDTIFRIQDDLKEFTEMALTDEMTDLPNYRAFCQKMGEELAVCLRAKQPLGVVILDIDKFKIFNDTHGHQQGDEVLREFSKSLKNSVRNRDFVARYGGEEFIIILPNTELEGIEVVCEKVRQQVEKTKVKHLANPGQYLSVTASFGGVCIEPQDLESWKDEDFKAFIEEADKNLYQAKESGRNKAICTYWRKD